MKNPWHGVYPAVTTQFNRDCSVDLPSTLREIDRLLGEGMHGIVLLGTVGECCSLEPHEKLELVRATAAHLKGRSTLLVGVAEYTTAQACRFAEAAERLGAGGLMVLPPMVYRSDRDETIAHFRAVAGASAAPILCYNNPVAYSVDITPEMFAELADEPNLVAIKESSDDVRRVTDLRNRLGSRYLIFSGVDNLFLESAVLGIDGWIAGLANALPSESRQLWDLAVEGRWTEARELYRWHSPLFDLDTRVKLVQCIKLAMVELGHGSETVRPPRQPLSGNERKEVLATIRQSLATRPARNGVLAPR